MGRPHRTHDVAGAAAASGVSSTLRGSALRNKIESPGTWTTFPPMAIGDELRSVAQRRSLGELRQRVKRTGRSTSRFGTWSSRHSCSGGASDDLDMLQEHMQTFTYACQTTEDSSSPAVIWIVFVFRPLDPLTTRPSGLVPPQAVH